jgi:Activator of Hsp90 ATPase homolog 1-like protein
VDSLEPVLLLTYVRDESNSPITHEYSLRSSPYEAFVAYTGGIGDWWDPRYTANAETLLGVTVEPRVGGRVYATHSDMGEHDWGVVTVWEPGHRLVHTFTLAQNVQHPSEVAVEFVPLQGQAESVSGCTMQFAHRGWTEANADARKRFGDWRVMLDRFVAFAERARRVTETYPCLARVRPPEPAPDR